MSRFVLRSSLVTVIGIAIGYFGTFIYKNIQTDQSRNRFIASTQMVKLASIQNAQQLFEIRAKGVVIASTQEETSTVKVVITPYEDYNNEINYTWQLPDEVRVISGSVSGSIPKFEKRKTVELILDIAGFSKEKRNFISFKLNGLINSLPVSQDILISSRPEDSFEYLVQQNATFEEKNKKLGKIKDTKKRFDPKNISH